MYLKAIKAHGFKSFADKTLIELDNKITGIVGPNGSGKSNVVDAIRWVLGEQSVKSLRGDGNMTDVIFSGSKSREGSNVASVTLIFDNSDKFFPFEYNEVAIKRRVYKDGTNEYFLNNEKVRLKDITNVLLDSGIAKESFNIISQGKIEEILSNKPDERRIIFEEASGVLKYKRRKEEALRKLEKTHLNMNRVNDIINELETRINPLKEEKEKALKYRDLSDELKAIEIALIANDITKFNFNYQQNKNKIDVLQLEISKLSTNSTVGEAKIEQYKQNIQELELKIRGLQEQLITLTSSVEKINSRKAIILERQKYNVADSKIHDNLISLKEKEFKINSEINNLRNEIKNSEDNIIAISLKLDAEMAKLNTVRQTKNNLENEINVNRRNENNLALKIETLRYSIENNSSLPMAVKKVLENPKLRGIHNIVGNVFEVDEKNSLAISVALGSSSTNVVVDNENMAKEAIKYLKDNNYGRATFLPLNIIKPKSVDSTTIHIIKNMTGYIDIASNLIKYDPKYQDIILNLLGNVIVIDTIDNANIIAKAINYKYRLVTLSGELIHVGGSVTGGSVAKARNIILDKYELDKMVNEAKIINETIQNSEEKINQIDDNYRTVEDKIYLINKEKTERELLLENYRKDLIEKEEQLKNITYEISGNNNILANELVNEEQMVLKEYYETLAKKDEVSLNLKNLIEQKEELNNELSDYELMVKKENSLFNEKKEILNQLEINVNRLDVKLDNLLNTLTENYSLTYDAAVTQYKLEIEEDIARNKVNLLKRQIKELGIVNLGAIKEFDEVNSRYEFLSTQKTDLLNAEDTLLKIIDEMDKVMEKEFLNTFKIIKENFTTTFKELFKGGTADLKLTNPSNVLETGIEIIASPPGKKLTTISLLSGGEKTFTAISLLFAILKSKPVPFCVLDEVEAALDDVNVDSFGKYIRSLKDKTQFIIITHKKKTMEYVDILYGITMQESGVSKLVSVRLEEIS